MSDLALNTLTSDDLGVALDIALDAGVTPFIWGSPGIGKSDIVRALAARMGRPLIDVRLSQWAAVDSRGIPFVSEGRTKWAIPEVFPTDPNANHIIFVDEFNTAKEGVMAAMYQLILDRRLGDYVLPENVLIIAAGNKESDHAITNKMGTALENRFVHFELAVDLDCWVSWALSNDVDMNVVIYLRNIKPDALHDWSPKSKTKGQPTPRSWARVSNVIKQDPQLLRRRAVQANIAGLIGDGHAASFMAYLDIAAKMPDPEECINNPDSAPIPKEPHVLYALCGAIAYRTDINNIDGAYRYADRLDPEFTALLVVDSGRIKPALKSTRSYVNWSIKNGKEQMK